MQSREGGQSHARSQSRARASNGVARRIEEAAEDGSWQLVDELLGETDCPDGCYVEPDGRCAHGWESGALSAGLI